jgi:hypothetical protein
MRGGIGGVCLVAGFVVLGAHVRCAFFSEGREGLGEVRGRTIDGRQSDTNELDECTSRFPSSQGSGMADPRLPRSLWLLDLVFHPGHPTAVGGLPASKPGLSAGAHDRCEAYLIKRRGCQWAGPAVPGPRKMPQFSALACMSRPVQTPLITWQPERSSPINI